MMRSFFTLFLLIILCTACSDTATKDETADQKETSTDRISKIEISQFGKVTQLLMSYDQNSVNIEFHPYKTNVDARITFNDKNNIQEIISGTSRIQYLYNENGRQIGIFADQGLQQIMFDYEGSHIAAQHTISGNDTVVRFFYTYSDGLPSEVEISVNPEYSRKYKLYYSDRDNQLSGFNELILPAELVSLLGIPAVYGKKYLKRAVRIDENVNKNQPLQEGYAPKMEEVAFEITASGKQETLELTSDGTRQWSAVIHR